VSVTSSSVFFGAAAALEPKLGRTKSLDDAVRVAKQEVGHVDEDAALALGRHRKAPVDRARERLLHRAPLVGVAAHGPVPRVGLDEEHLGTDPLEVHERRSSALPAIQPDVVRPDAGLQAREVEHVGVQLPDLHVERARRLVPVEREETIELLHAGGLLFDRRGLAAGQVSRLAAGRRRLPRHRRGQRHHERRRAGERRIDRHNCAKSH
jgi:hypothetical protein